MKHDSVDMPMLLPALVVGTAVMAAGVWLADQPRHRTRKTARHLAHRAEKAISECENALCRCMH